MVTDLLTSDRNFASSHHMYRDLSVPLLVEHAILRHEAQLAVNGALVATTGKRTGRSPGDKFVVRNVASADSVEWGPINQPMDQVVYDALRTKALDYAQDTDLFLLNAFAGADPGTRLPVQIISEFAWHSLFARQLLIRATSPELAEHAPSFQVLSLPGFHAVPKRDGTYSETAVAIDFERHEVLIVGTEYAGEIKKSLFTVMNLLLPQQGVLSMHCSANVGKEGDVALFFGLSGTGKTSLSSDPDRRLVGDDEHGWGDAGVFNIEGGCYAKCIRLRREAEPQIYDAIRFGSVIENVVIDPHTREPDYDDDTLTENTRVAYPIDYIDNVVLSGQADHPQAVIFLSADSFGVLPPISLLSTEQAMYYFLSGYTSKLAGTEAGVTTPQATFSSCFGAAFLPRRPGEYANLLRERIERHEVRCYLINTGWSGGPYGTGSRISINYTRAMVRAAINGDIERADIATEPIFGLRVPTTCPGVPSNILFPRQTWPDPEAYDRQARQLAARFRQNFEQFTLVSDEVRAAGPR
jgi:phosphoenolpyruvate carboxykinase (ATP)